MNTTIFLLTVTLGVWSISSGNWPVTASAMPWKDNPTILSGLDSYRIMGVPDNSSFVEVSYEKVPLWVHRVLKKHCYIADLIRAWVGNDGSYIVEYSMHGMGRAVYYIHFARW